MTSRLKVKNPCNICLQSVTNKTGIQCRGACRKWAHFNCLNYSPGKVKDIKSGAINITCPCPDCLTEGTKGTLTKPLSPCTNQKCPVAKPIPPVLPCRLVSPQSSPQSSNPKICPPTKQAQKAREPPCGPNPPCAQPKQAKPTKPAKPLLCPFLSPCPSKEAKPPSPQSCSCEERNRHSGPKSQPLTGIKLDVIRSSSSSSSQQRQGLPKAPCVQSSSSESSGASSCPALAKKMVKKTKSCACVSREGGMMPKVQKTSSDTNIQSTDSLYETIQDMCKTVGQLSNQLKQLMCKMMDAN